MSAHHAGVIGEPQLDGGQACRPLYLDPRHRNIGSPQAALDLRGIRGRRIVADVWRSVGGQPGHERIDLLLDESTLARSRIDQAAGDEPLDGVADRVAGCAVLSLKIELGGQRLAVAADLAALNLLA